MTRARNVTFVEIEGDPMRKQGRASVAVAELRDRLRVFAEERDWDQFHSPKNLASALIVEAGELLEIFQWQEEKASRRPSTKHRSQAAEEMADVFIYLVRLADKLDVDLVAAAHRKIDANAVKYPVAKARGRSLKYTEL